MNQSKDLIESYVSWLRENTFASKASEDWIEITTPFLDRHNDCLQIYAKVTGDVVELSDGGYIIDDLLSSGLAFSTKKRRDLLKQTVAGFGVDLSKDQQLQVKASLADFPRKKNDLLQAMLALNDMFVLAEPNITTFFFEDVTKWLDDSDIRYSPRVRLTGKSGFDHNFDFIIPKSKTHPERVIQLITSPTRATAERTAFHWIDTKDVRPMGAKAYAVLNDAKSKGIEDVSKALQNYEIEPILWSGRSKMVDELRA